MFEYVEYTKRHHLKSFDYSTNTSYMLTICVSSPAYILSNISHTSDGFSTVTTLTKLGQQVEQVILSIENHHENVTLDSYVIMPDHIHLLLTINRKEEISAYLKQIPRIVKGMKFVLTKTTGFSVFQQNYYDVICDTDILYDNCYDYIKNNPAVWLLKHGEEPPLEGKQR